MKRIDAIIQEDKLDVVTDALKETGITGITITQSRGIGTGERPVLRGSRGTAKFVALYNRLETIMTVVDGYSLPLYFALRKQDPIIKNSYVFTSKLKNTGFLKI